MAENIIYTLQSMTWADKDNPTAVSLYRELVIEAMFQKLKKNGKLRWPAFALE